MNYPLISEYVEAIKSAEDNLKELTNLRPVLSDDGQPLMTSVNFAVVFKMQDFETSKFYALKCFIKDQEGREEAYHQIAEELKDVDSPYLVSISYLEKELFVDSTQIEETEFPVLLMDWVEGKTLDKYLRENLDDKYALEMLAYRFSQLALWLIPQPFAHGDLKPDNILVREDGTLVLVDYDGMYVPAMKGQKTREIGSPDFQHPNRTEFLFNEYIDDFSIATIFFSLNHIAKTPSLLNKYGACDRLLFCKDDYYNFEESEIIQFLYPADDFIDSNYSILKLALDDGYFKNVDLSWFRIPNKSFELIDKTIPQKIKVLYNGSCFNMIYVEGGSFYKGAQNNNSRLPNYDYEAEINEGPVEKCTVDDFWISESLITMDIWPWFGDNPDGVHPYNIRERRDDDNKNAVYGVSYKDCVEFIRGLSKATNVKFDFPTEVEWEYAARGGKYSKGYKYSGSDSLGEIALYGKETDGYSFPLCKVRTKKPNELGIYDMSGGLYEWCKNDYSPEDFIEFDKSLIPYLLDNPIIHVKRGGCITSNAHECRITNRRRDNFFKIAADEERRTYYEGGDDYYPSVYWWQVGLRLVAHNIDLNSIENNEIKSFSSGISEAERNSKIIDAFGAEYSDDKLIKVPDDIVEYSVKEGTRIVTRDIFHDLREKKIQNVYFPLSLKVIGSNAFWECKYLQDLTIPGEVFRIGVGAFTSCESLSRIVLPSSIKYIENGAFSHCYSLREITIPDGVDTLENDIFSCCSNLEEVIIPSSIITICEDVFWNCTKLRSITIPENVKEIKRNPFRGSGIEEVICESPNYVFENGLLMTADRKELIACLTNKRYVLVPSTIKVIRDYAFNGCKSIKQIFLPDGLTDIMYSAISDCASLSELTIPSSVRVIHRGFLSECGNFKRLIIQSKDVWFEDNTSFYKSESISQIIVPQEVKESFCKNFPNYSNIMEDY